MNEFPYIGSINDRFEWKELDRMEFSIDEIVKLKAIKSGADINSVEIGQTWSKRGEQYINLVVNGIKFSAIHIASDFYGDNTYAVNGDKIDNGSLAKYIVNMMKWVTNEDIDMIWTFNT